MAAGNVYRKTELGVAEIANRKMKLSPRLRTMLILIDGAQPEFLVKEDGERLGAPPDFLAQLSGLGLIELAERVDAPPQPSAGAVAAADRANDEFLRFRRAKDFMNVTIVDALGIKSFFFTLKLEKAGTREDLRDLATAYREALEKSLGERSAGVLAQRLEVMLR